MQHIRPNIFQWHNTFSVGGCWSKWARQEVVFFPSSSSGQTLCAAAAREISIQCLPSKKNSNLYILYGVCWDGVSVCVCECALVRATIVINYYGFSVVLKPYLYIYVRDDMHTHTHKLTTQKEVDSKFGDA